MSEKPDWRIQWLVAQAKDERLTDAEVRSIIANFPHDPALSVPEGWVAVPREVVEPFVEAPGWGAESRKAREFANRVYKETKGPTPELKRLYAELLENDRREAALSAIPSPGGEGSSRGLADQPSASRSLNSSAHAPGEGVAE